MEHKFHLHLLLNLLLWLALTSYSFSSTASLPCSQGGVCNGEQGAAGTGAANLNIPPLDQIVQRTERHDDKKEDVNKVSGDLVRPRSDEDVEENKVDQKSSKENENQCDCPMETSESIASKQFKGVLASVIRQRLSELSEKARAATEAAHTFELLMLLGESNLGSDQMNKKVT